MTLTDGQLATLRLLLLLASESAQPHHERTLDAAREILYPHKFVFRVDSKSVILEDTLEGA